MAKNIEKKVDINSKYASKVRVAQFKDNVVRVVVETDVKKSGYDIFGIVGGETPYRVQEVLQVAVVMILAIELMKILILIKMQNPC